MKNISFFFSFILLLLCSCTEEKDYYLETVVNGQVIFKATNITLPAEAGDSATSMIFRYSFDDGEYRNPTVEFNINFHIEEYPDIEHIAYITLDYRNILWLGGNNEIKIDYTPSCPEEKSATFTFPDGSTKVLTRENPSYIWKYDRQTADIIEYKYYYRDLLPIYAISKFDRDGVHFVNSGYVPMDIRYYENLLYYDETLRSWWLGNWRNN